MIPEELIEKIKAYTLDESTQKSTIKVFLNEYIRAGLYDEIEGNSMEEKVQLVYDYLQNDNKKSKEPEVKQTLNIVIADDASSLDYVSYLKEKFEIIVHKTTDVKNP